LKPNAEPELHSRHTVLAGRSDFKQRMFSAVTPVIKTRSLLRRSQNIQRKSYRFWKKREKEERLRLQSNQGLRGDPEPVV